MGVTTGTRSIDWHDGAVVAVDQRALPGEYRLMRLTTVDEVIGAIRTLAVRGAPAIGAAGAFAVALAALATPDERQVRAEAERIAAARPTAVNLRWAVDRVLRRLPEGADAVLDEALALLTEDEETTRAAASRAAGYVLAVCERRPLRLLTHCNTGRLATVAWGTALGAIRELAAAGHVAEVLAGETRPLLQGARLTAWELAEAGIPHRLCVDSAGPAAIAAGLVDCVLVGADRIAANGDTANKIGTYALAVAAARHGVPFVVVAPESTLDPAIADGRDIVIEERAADEVTGYADRAVAPAGTRVYNPAFDVTPRELITAIVTENTVMTT
ncbi:S-methyl-5-thioribose-1-phosphate isomerase [Nonomuraea sp. NPDC049649]|uniref:S-methyl-5-thioribose-1-phosphate isomerase n=1 Tax=Nonomuraea sp. NPDC049649 TaxID=3155776 RepID=UPI0034465382